MVASYGEDTITMAMEASSDCLKGMDRKSIDAVFFATTNLPTRRGWAPAFWRPPWICHLHFELWMSPEL